MGVAAGRRYAHVDDFPDLANERRRDERRHPKLAEFARASGYDRMSGLVEVLRDSDHRLHPAEVSRD